MECVIFIHSDGTIVEEFKTEFESMSELDDLLEYARKKYGSLPEFAFDVMFYVPHSAAGDS